MLDLAVSLWLYALLVTSSLLGLVVVVQSLARLVRLVWRRPVPRVQRPAAAPFGRRAAA